MAVVPYLKKGPTLLFDGLFVLLLLAFVVYKISDLSLPYFWDELGVYSQAAVYQYKHGLSLLPSSVPPEISRGHPLLFTFLNATAMKISGGTSVLTVHIFNLCITLALLIIAYYKTYRHLDKATALVTILLLVSQPVFVAQASLMLPEICLSLFVLLALFAFYEKNYLQFAFWASLAILTKETAVILPATVFFYSVILWLKSTDRPVRKLFSQLLACAIPYAVLGSFLVLQKLHYGWFFFPYHIDIMVKSIAEYSDNLLVCSSFIFKEQGRFLWTTVLILALIATLVRKNEVKNITILLSLFVLLSFLFNAANFHMNRYLLLNIVPLALLTSMALATLIPNQFYAAAPALLLAFTSISFFEPSEFNYDADLGYRKPVKTLQQGIDYLSQVSKGEKYVFANFPGYFALNFPESGYLQNHAIKPKLELDDSVSYLLMCNPGTPLGSQTDKYNMKLIREFKDGFAVARVYSLEKK